jgi:hypothetical protein
MDWTAQLDGYCERLGPGLWAEPWNLVTNAAFLISALVMARRCPGMPGGQALALILFVIGIGSGLFHSFATGWAMLADTGPILIFILAYLFLASRDFLGLAPLHAGLATAAFLPYAAATVPLFGLIPGLGSSAGYAPVPVLIFFYAWLLRHKAPATARGLATGAALLVLSLSFRTVDAPLCPAWPLGTHFLWHLLNAVLLAWMIEVWRRHRLEAGTARR